MQRMHVEQVEEKENIEELKRYTEMKKQEVEVSEIRGVLALLSDIVHPRTHIEPP